MSVDGLLLVDKPPGPTSHDIVARVRRLLGERRVGHAGTLDPPASGLLAIVLGRATRLVRFLPSSPKVYRGAFRLGITTSTDDLTGEVLRESGDVPGSEAVRAAGASLVGSHEQVPPAVSARRVGGERLYRLARRGVTVQARATPVEVARFDLEPTHDPAVWTFETEVSGGTYVRSLVRDLGAALGCGGALTALRRTAIGPLRVADAVSLAAPRVDPELLRSAARPLEAMPLDPPPVRLLGPEDEARFVSGIAGAATAAPPAGGLCRVLSRDGRLLGIGSIEDGRIAPRVVLGPPGPVHLRGA